MWVCACTLTDRGRTRAFSSPRGIEALRRYVRFSHLLLWPSGDAIFKFPKNVTFFRLCPNFPLQFVSAFLFFQHQFCQTFLEEKSPFFFVSSKNDKNSLLLSLGLSTFKVQGYGFRPFFGEGWFSVTVSWWLPEICFPRRPLLVPHASFENEKCYFQTWKFAQSNQFYLCSYVPMRGIFPPRRRLAPDGFERNEGGKPISWACVRVEWRLFSWCEGCGICFKFMLWISTAVFASSCIGLFRIESSNSSPYFHHYEPHLAFPP